MRHFRIRSLLVLAAVALLAATAVAPRLRADVQQEQSSA